MVPKTMSTNGSDNNAEADLALDLDLDTPFENLDTVSCTLNDHGIVTNEEKTNCSQVKQSDLLGSMKNNASTIGETIDEVPKANEPDASDQSTDNTPKTDSLKKWVVLLLPMVVVVWWWLKRMSQLTVADIQPLELNELKDVSNALTGVYALAGAVAAVAALLLVKLFQKLSKQSKLIQDQQQKIIVLTKELGEQGNRIGIRGKELNEQNNKIDALVKELGEANNKIGTLRKELGWQEKKTDVLSEELECYCNKIKDLGKELDELKGCSVANAKCTIQKLMDLKASSANVKIDGIKEFLGSSESKKSREFECYGLTWLLTLTTTYVKGSGEQLSVFLYLANAGSLNHFPDWSVNVTFDLKLLFSNRDNPNNDIQKTANHVFRKGVESGVEEWTQFVSVGTLNSHYIKQDAIEFALQFKSLKIE